MRRRTPTLLSFAWVAAPFVLAATAAAQTTTRVSVDTAGFEANLQSEYPVLSRNGRWVAFESQASNLVPGDTNANGDIFVHDRLTGATRRVSVDALGLEGNGPSRECAISADGRFVAFQSDASNLVPGDTNQTWDIFVVELATGAIERVSVNTAGAEANGISGAPALSADGRCVVFASTATNLVRGDTNTQRDIFLRDRLLGTTERISVDSGGAQMLGGAADLPSISGDGQRVVFMSSAANLVAGDTNGVLDVFLRDRAAGATIRVSVTIFDTQANGASSAPKLSLDGAVIAFQSSATNLVPGDTNANIDVFVRDLFSSTTERVSVGLNAAQPNGPSTRPSITADGLRVLYQTTASNVIAGDTNGSASDVCLFDRTNSTTTAIGLSFDGRQVADGAEFCALAADGLTAAFTSYSFKMVPKDANGVLDVFVRDFAPGALTPVAFCNGDASATACPCGNDAPAGTLGGCVNSLGASARLEALGEARVSLDSLRLVGTGLTNSTAIFLQGTARENGGAGTVFGDGLSCIGGSLTRLGSRTAAVNTAEVPGGVGQLVSVRGGCLPGDVRQYQIYYRNASAAFCTPETFNLSNAVEVTWAP
jgi:Tol biopolymer transport system component